MRGLIAMRSLALLILLLIINLYPMASPSYSDNNGERYYTYALISSMYHGSKPVINESIVFKLVSVNETAYRVVLVEYNESSTIGGWFKNSLELLMNRTGGIVSVNANGVIMLFDPAAPVFWIPKDMLEKAIKAADAVNHDRDRVCKPYRDLEACENTCTEKYKDNYTAISECKKECWKQFIPPYNENPVYPLQLALTGSSSPAVMGLSGIICGRLQDPQIKTISAKQVSNLYVFRLEATYKQDRSVTIKTVYSSNGWLIQYISREITKMKSSEGGEEEHISMYTIKLIDTNDDTVKTAIKDLISIDNIGNNGGIFSSLPMDTETLTILVGVAAIIAVAVVFLKKLL